MNKAFRDRMPQQIAGSRIRDPVERRGSPFRRLLPSAGVELGKLLGALAKRSPAATPPFRSDVERSIGDRFKHPDRERSNKVIERLIVLWAQT
jgi:hypothetical protein